MAIIFSVLSAMIAGFINGSYAFPVKYMSKWNQENIWLPFSALTFVVIPWVSISLLVPHIFQIINVIPISLLLILIGSGFVFGIGMILFSFSLKYVGLGVSFMLNISLGTICGSLLPTLLLDGGKVLSAFELIHIAGMVLFILGVVAASRASVYRKMSSFNKINNKKANYLGILCGIISGFFTSFQGMSYAYTFPEIQAIGRQFGLPSLGIDNVPWLAIFSAAFIPYAIYFFMKMIKNRSYKKYISENVKYYWIFIFVMGIFYFSSILFYTYSANLIGVFGPALSWPIMMIFVIITSNFWGLFQGEWKMANVRAYSFLVISIFLLITAVCLLAIDSYFSVSIH